MNASIVFPIIQLLLALGASLGTFFLGRLSLGSWREKKTVKGILLSLATLVVAFFAVVFIMMVFGGVIILIRNH